MTKKLLPPSAFNLAATRDKARTNWLDQQRQSVTFLDRLVKRLPLGQIVMAVFLFILTGSHTINAFHQVIGGDIVIAGMTIPVSTAAVFVVDFGVLACAFYRYDAKARNEKADDTLKAVEYTLGAASLIANVAGSIGVAADQLANLTDIRHSVAVIQAFFMVPVAGIMMPLSLHNVGTMIARLIHNRNRDGDPLLARWQTDGPDVLHIAIHDELVLLGMSGPQANRLALAYVKNTFAVTGKPKVTGTAPEKPERAGTETVPDSRPKLPTGQVIQRLHKDHPGFSELPIKSQVDLVIEGSRRSESTVYEAVGKYRAWVAQRPTAEPAASSNGNGHNEGVAQ